MCLMDSWYDYNIILNFAVGLTLNILLALVKNYNVTNYVITIHYLVNALINTQYVNMFRVRD